MQGFWDKWWRVERVKDFGVKNGEILTKMGCEGWLRDGFFGLAIFGLGCLG